MKYQFLLLFIAAFGLLSAQPTYLESFETFTPSGQPAPFDWAEPDNWTSSNRLTEFIAPAITQTEEAYDGDYAIRLDSRKIFDEVTPAKLILGEAPADYISSELATEGAGILVEGQLNKLRGYYKYRTTGQSQGSLQVQITRWYEDGGRSIVFETEQLFAPTDDFSLFEIAFDTYSFEPDKDSLLLVFSSSADAATGNETSSLIVDALSIDYLTSVDEVKQLPQSALLVSPVPAALGEELNIALEGPNPSHIRAVFLLNAKGERLYHSTTQSGTISLSSLPLSPGLHFVVAETASGLLLAKKIIVTAK